MAERITTGTILVEEGVILPDSLRVESEPYSNGWRIVKELDGYGLKNERSGMDLFLHGKRNQSKRGRPSFRKISMQGGRPDPDEAQVGKIQFPGDY